MINRMRGFYGEPDEPKAEDDYFVVAYDYEDFYVTREVAQRIVLELDAPAPPRWIRFTDVHGSNVTVRSRRIDHVREWTAEQRQAARAFRRARDQEGKTDRRPWDDDD